MRRHIRIHADMRLRYAAAILKLMFQDGNSMRKKEGLLHATHFQNQS